MSDRWIRLRGTGDDPIRPDYVWEMGLDYSGNEAHPDGAPTWVVRVYGTDAELETLAGKTGATRLGSVPVQALNQMFGQNRDAASWERGFKIESE